LEVCFDLVSKCRFGVKTQATVSAEEVSFGNPSPNILNLHETIISSTGVRFEGEINTSFSEDSRKVALNSLSSILGKEKRPVY
jgi:hypothetical protein